MLFSQLIGLKRSGSVSPDNGRYARRAGVWPLLNRSAALRLVALPLAVVAGLSFLSSCSHDPLVAGDLSSMDISLFEQPLGGEREAISKSLDALWQSESQCETQKTGYGLTRRAYFLETCSYPNQSGGTVCNRAVEKAHYRFFEGTLVQVVFEFDGNTDAEYQSCVQENAVASKYRAGTDSGWLSADEKVSLRMDSTDKTEVSDAEEVSKIHFLRQQ